MRMVESERSVELASKRQLNSERRRPRKRVYLFTLAVLLLSIVAGALSTLVVFHAYSDDYQRYTALARTGELHLQTAITLLEAFSHNPFDTTTIDHAQREFVAAHTVFVELDEELASFPGIANLIPVYGGRLSAAQHLASAAVDLAQAGVVGCSILDVVVGAFHDPLSTGARGMTMSNLNAIDHDFQQVKTSLEQAIAEAKQVQPGDVQFIPQVSKMLANFQEELPVAQNWLDAAGALLPALPALLGIGATPAHYLIEVLDSSELRPAGGFIGNYGIATLSGGRLTSARITDVVLLDHPYEVADHTIAYPAPYSWFAKYLSPNSWSFRDSNLDADFPTAAQYGEQNYEQEGGNVPLQGVIAITPALIQRALAITGPIDVPEYSQVVTPQNLVALIHYHQLGGSAAGEGSSYIPSPDGHSSERKRFTELLAEHFLTRVQQLPSAALTKFLQVLADSLRTKDVQLYFNNGAAEHVLQLLHLDDAIQSPQGDHLLIVDANVSPNKANSFIVTTVHDQVAIDECGNAVHHTTIVYAWTLPGRDYGQYLYRDYVRIYLPQGSTLTKQLGWQPHGTSSAFGDQVWAGFFTFVFGQTRTITLVWTTHGAASRDANGWHYQYLLQRQAGTQRTLALQVTLPTCATVTGRSGGLQPGYDQAGVLTESWTADQEVGLAYHGC